MTARRIRITTTCLALPAVVSRERPIEKARNLARASHCLERAGKLGSDLVLLPEGFATKGLRQTFTSTRASYRPICEPIPGGEIAELAASHARRHRMYVVAPIFEREGDALYNTAAVFDRRGRLAGKYRKVHLPPPVEARIFKPGDATPVFDLDFGRVAVAICWDLNFPELARGYALAGAEVLCWPTMWGETADYQLAFMRGQALANILYLVGANFCMPDGKVGHPGQSAVIAPDGRVLANTGNRPGIASAVIDLHHARLRARQQLFAGRRPDLYGRLVAPAGTTTRATRITHDA